MHVPGGDQLLEASIYEPSQQPTTSASIKVYAYGRGGQEWGGGRGERGGMWGGGQACHEQAGVLRIFTQVALTGNAQSKPNGLHSKSIYSLLVYR